jgi:hypothetical protein
LVVGHLETNFAVLDGFQIILANFWPDKIPD